MRRDQDWRDGSEQGAIREATAEAHRTQREHPEGHRDAHELLRHGAGQHRVLYGWLERAQDGAKDHRGLHAEHAPDLSHQGAHDQARARQGPGAGGPELGQVPAQVQEEERAAQEALQDWQGQEGPGVPARAPAEQD